MSGKNKKLILFSLSLLSAISFTVKAQPLNQHILVTPECLINKTDSNYQVITSDKSLSLVTASQSGIDRLITAKNSSKTPCGGFMDVTRAWNKYKKLHADSADMAAGFLAQYTKSPDISNNTKYEIKYQKQVNQLLPQLNPQEMWDFLSTLTSYQDRYASSDNGVKAAEWFKSQVEAFAKSNNRSDVTVYTVATRGYKQPSVIAKIGNSSEPGIVIGAHMDTLSGSFSKKPGADDDGSGSVVVLEAARTLLASGMTFKKPVYLIWYAAEEEGLVGSGSVVTEFSNKKIPVDAVLHFDLTGYAYQNDPTMYLIDDYVDKNLSAYLGKLIDTYVKQPIKHTRCGYACSDHASWTQGGYAAAIPAESAYEDTNPNIHSSQDTMDKLSLSHMTDYLKLATAFAVEMAEPVNK